MVIKCSFIFFRPYIALTLWPFIFVKRLDLIEDNILLNHEKIHMRQQLELGILPFYLIYIGEWLWGCLRYGNFYDAYNNISFEREAYLNENNSEYLKERRPFAFWEYWYEMA